MATEGLSLTAPQALNAASLPADRVKPVADDIRQASAAASSPPTEPAVDLTDLKAQLASINSRLRDLQSNLSFSVDETTGKTIVRVFRESTGELVRQIPSEEVIAIAANLARGEPLRSLGLEAWS
jgi:flagellar protein FlaG